MLSDLENWELIDGGKAISRTFVLEDFQSALGFVNRVGELAEQADHHPDIRIFDYKKVEIRLTSHDVGKVTSRDTELAKGIDELSV